MGALCYQSMKTNLDTEKWEDFGHQAKKRATWYTEHDEMQHAEAYSTLADVAEILVTYNLNNPRDFFVVFERIHFNQDYKEVL